jgi:bifunctional non-homologous end joining protein LigD
MLKSYRKLSSFIEPMKAQLTDQPAFNSCDWLFEIKWDGYRAIAEINKSGNKLYSTNGLTFDKAYPKIFEGLKAIKKDAMIDGEIVVFDENGKTNFQTLRVTRSSTSSLDSNSLHSLTSHLR